MAALAGTALGIASKHFARRAQKETDVGKRRLYQGLEQGFLYAGIAWNATVLFGFMPITHYAKYALYGVAAVVGLGLFKGFGEGIAQAARTARNPVVKTVLAGGLLALGAAIATAAYKLGGAIPDYTISSPLLAACRVPHFMEYLAPRGLIEATHSYFKKLIYSRTHELRKIDFMGVRDEIKAKMKKAVMSKSDRVIKAERKPAAFFLALLPAVAAAIITEFDFGRHIGQVKDMLERNVVVSEFKKTGAILFSSAPKLSAVTPQAPLRPSQGFVPAPVAA
ncbi:MAG: hypothetical protein KGI97_08590 [Alphaproteobacteria bacterium]|nr:hypothetical protein [Alphaproteobacteria bacterium]